MRNTSTNDPASPARAFVVDIGLLLLIGVLSTTPFVLDLNG